MVLYIMVDVLKRSGRMDMVRIRLRILSFFLKKISPLRDFEHISLLDIDTPLGHKSNYCVDLYGYHLHAFYDTQKEQYMNYILGGFKTQVFLLDFFTKISKNICQISDHDQ